MGKMEAPNETYKRPHAAPLSPVSSPMASPILIVFPRRQLNQLCRCWWFLGARPGATLSF
jgi:hypothetical protein